MIFSRVVALISILNVFAACGTSPQAFAPTTLPTANVVEPPNTSIRIQPMRLPSFATTPTSVVQPTLLPKVAALPITQTTVTLSWPREQPPADVAAIERGLGEAINAVRVQNGLPAYNYNAELSAVARSHSCDLAAHALISHTSTNGRTLQDRLGGATPPWQWPSESIAAGVSDVNAVVAMWMDEPPTGWHRRNILDTEQREVGVGYCYTAADSSGNHHYWTADFSRR